MASRLFTVAAKRTSKAGLLFLLLLQGTAFIVFAAPESQAPAVDGPTCARAYMDIPSVQIPFDCAAFNQTSLTHAGSCVTTIQSKGAGLDQGNLLVDVSLSDNRSSAVITVGGATVTFVVTVTYQTLKADHQVAENVVVSHSMPAGLVILSVTGPDAAGCSHDQVAMTCKFDSIASMQQKTVSVSTQGVFAGTYSSCATATCTSVDLNPQDNKGCSPPVKIKGACCTRLQQNASCKNTLPDDCPDSSADGSVSQFSAQAACRPGICSPVTRAGILQTSGACCVRKGVCIRGVSRDTCMVANKGLSFFQSSNNCRRCG